MPAKPDDGIYSIFLKRGDFELQVSAPDQAWVESRVDGLMGWASAPAPLPDAPSGGTKVDAPAPAKAPSLAEHVRAVAPSGGLEHVLAIGYYLERYSRLNGGFRRRDLAEAFKAIRYQHSNPGVPIATARRQGLLMDGEEHEKLLLTETAERWVEERLGA